MARVSMFEAVKIQARVLIPVMTALESEIVENTADSLAIHMTACEFARYFREIGHPQIGALLTCNVDFAVNEKLRPSWEFRRTQTQMEGAAFCDFRWRLRAKSEP